MQEAEVLVQELRDVADDLTAHYCGAENDPERRWVATIRNAADGFEAVLKSVPK